MNGDPDGQHLVIERTLDATPELVWRMWTDEQHFAAWYGPMGTTIPVARMDVRVGGKRLLCMELTTPNGTMRMWFSGEYLEVVENRRLVYTDFISDEHGTVRSSQQMGTSQEHPSTTEVTVELEPYDGGTRMVLTHSGVPAESPGAAGWTMALDKLAAHIDEAQRH